MHCLDEFIHLRFGDRPAETPGPPMVSQALLATADLQKLVVVVHVPLIGEAEFFERHIEGDAVPVSLGVNDDAVQVEEDGPNASH